MNRELARTPSFSRLHPRSGSLVWNRLDQKPRDPYQSLGPSRGPVLERIALTSAATALATCRKDTPVARNSSRSNEFAATKKLISLELPVEVP